jgi:hypothetical protein
MSTSECQIPTLEGSPSSRSSSRRDDKARIVNYILDFPDGVPFVKVVGEVFDKKGTIEPDSDYQLARRYVRNAEYLETAKRDGLLWVHLSDDGLPLEPQLARGKTSGRDGDDENPSFSSEETGDPNSRRYAKDRVRHYFKDKKRVRADSIRSWLLEELGTELRSIEDKYNVFRHLLTEETAAVPYRTRFNDVSRATSVLEGFEDALSRASERFFTGTFLTLTLDPKRFDGHEEATDALYENKSRLMSWLSSEYRLGHRPDNLTVLEFQESGMPHAHVCLFGVTPSELPSEEEIREYWNERRDVGSQVHTKSMRRRHDGTFLLRDTEEGDNTDVSLHDYLTDGMYGLIRVANSDPGELLEAAEEGETSLWKQALYWYTERRYWSGSPSLTDDDTDTDDGLPHVSMWEYVGTYHVSDIPARVFRTSDDTDTDDGDPGDRDDGPPPPRGEPS